MAGFEERARDPHQRCRERGALKTRMSIIQQPTREWGPQSYCQEAETCLGYISEDLPRDARRPESPSDMLTSACASGAESQRGGQASELQSGEKPIDTRLGMLSL